MNKHDSRALIEVIERCRPVAAARPNVLQTLLAIQDAIGSVSVEAIPRIARTLNVTEAEVAGVLSYYPDLRRHSTGRHLVRVCMGESCTANHGGRILRELHEQLRVDVNETTLGGRFTLEKVYCVGNCAVSPSLIIDGDLYGRVTPGQIGTLLERYK